MRKTHQVNDRGGPSTLNSKILNYIPPLAISGWKRHNIDNLFLKTKFKIGFFIERCNAERLSDKYKSR